MFGDHSRGSGSGSNFYDSMRPMTSSAAIVEGFQAQLKLREGELVQMQLELANIERSRDNLSAEVTRLTQKLDSLGTLEEELAYVKKEYAAMSEKYQTMLTMYGEKVEEAEELRLDLADVKDMYKVQIEELVRKAAA
jgi:predicted RNase H-like nuclease (RuvC/YqgF family)